MSTEMQFNKREIKGKQNLKEDLKTREKNSVNKTYNAFQIRMDWICD